MIEYLNKVKRPSILVLPKMSGYVKAFKVKDGNKDKNNNLASFCVDYDKVLEKDKNI